MSIFISERGLLQKFTRLLDSMPMAFVQSTLQLTPAGKKALTSQADKNLRTIWIRWLETTLLDELNRVNGLDSSRRLEYNLVNGPRIMEVLQNMKIQLS